MSVRDLLLEIVYAFKNNKLRNSLTILGIVIGIASVVCLTSLIEGMKDQLLNEVGAGQANSLMLQSGLVDLDESDIDYIKEELPQVDFIGVSSSVSYGTPVATRQRENTASVNVVSIGLMERMSKNFKLTQGRYLNQVDEKHARQVCIISSNMVERLFGDKEEQVVGKVIRLGMDNYSIVGVVDSSVSGFGGGMQRDSVYISTGTGKLRFGSSGKFRDLVVFVKDKEDLPRSKEELIRALEEKYPQARQEDQGPSTDMFGGPSSSFHVISSDDLVKMVESITTVFTAILGSVAAISLLVGGIGIMNMMLTNVTERIKEIGLRKSLGARRRDIERQFVGESVGLCLIGGALGLLLGYMSAYAIAALISVFSPDLSVRPVLTFSIAFAAFAVSALIGIGFGWGPARKAARLDPVQSLRHQ